MADHPSIVEALSAVMDDVGAVRKDGVNSAQGFNFRGIDAVVNAVGPALRKHGVVVMPCVLEAHYASVTVGRNQSQMRECTLKVTYAFHGPNGDSLSATVWGEALDSGDKATAKAHSVAMRTALLQALCIPTDEPDPDETSYERAAAPVAPPVEPGEGWDTRAEQEAVWARLKRETKDGDEDGAVAAWLKAEGIKMGTFTAAVAKEWADRLHPVHVPDASGEEPF